MKRFFPCLVLAVLLCSTPIPSSAESLGTATRNSAGAIVPASLMLMMRKRHSRRHVKAGKQRVRASRRSRRSLGNRRSKQRDRGDKRRLSRRHERRADRGRHSRRGRAESRGNRRGHRHLRRSRRSESRRSRRAIGRRRHGRGGRVRIGRHRRGRHARLSHRRRGAGTTGVSTAPGPTNNRRAELKRRYPEIRH